MNKNEVDTKISDIIGELKDLQQVLAQDQTAQNFPIENMEILIKQSRKNMKLSLSDVSDLSGIAIGTVHKIESGNQKVNLNNLISVLEVLGINLCLQKK